MGKGESLITIIEKYAISESQLLEYNPLVGRVGVKRRMTLRIPVYAFEVKQAEKAASNTVTTSISSFVHLVTPKETKWRLAYQYGTTIAVLDSLNPEIKEGLKINLKRSKTDQFGEGSVKGLPYFDNLEYCPVISIKKWIQISNISSGSLFRRFSKGSKLTESFFDSFIDFSLIFIDLLKICVILPCP